MANKTYPILNNFSKGELSSRMEGRVDIQAYYQGARIMENCIMVAQGGAEKRPGTIYLGEVYDPNGDATKARLIPFEISDTEIYVLEVGHRATRIWDVQTKALVESGGSPVILVTPYGEDDLSGIQFATTEGQIFMAHEDYPFQSIKKEDDVFILEQQYYPVADWDSTLSYEKEHVVYSAGDYYEALRATTIAATPTAGEWQSTEYLGATPTGDITEYTGGNFTVGDIVLYEGKIYKALRTYSGTSGANCFPGTEVQEYTWEEGSEKTKNVWYSSLKCITKVLGICFQRETVKAYMTRKYSSTTTNYVHLSTWEIQRLLYVVTYRVDTRVITSTKDDATYAYWDSPIAVPGGDSVSTVYSYTAGTYSEGDVVYDPSTYLLYYSLSDSNTATPGALPEWELLSNSPFFSIEGDYPSAVAFMGQRLFLGGTKSKPQTVFASRITDFTDFNSGTDDDDPFSFTIAAERSSRIKWMIGRDHLFLGTTSSEWLITGGSYANITPSNVQVFRQSAYGSAYNQANFVADALLFYQKGGRKLREYTYSNDNKAYLANDLTFFADHITESGIVESSYQQNPDSIFWNIKTDGGLVGLTYDRNNGIAGWHSHETQGAFESVCAVDGVGDEDEVWVVSRRTIDGSYKRFIEYMGPRVISNEVDLVYSDSAVVVSHGSTFVITSITNNTTSIQVAYEGSTGIADDDYIKIADTDNSLFDQQIFVVENLVQDSTTGTFDLKKAGDTFTADDFDTITTGHVSIVKKFVIGLDHLLGETVAILGDGSVFALQEVVSDVDGSGGVGVELDSFVNKAICGLPYTMTLQPEAIEIPGNATLGSNSRVSAVTLKLYKSLGGFVGDPAGEEEKMNFRSTDLPLGVATPLYTGQKIVPIEANSERESRIQIRHDDPLPFTVLAIVSDITYSR